MHACTSHMKCAKPLLWSSNAQEKLSVYLRMIDGKLKCICSGSRCSWYQSIGTSIGLDEISVLALGWNLQMRSRFLRKAIKPRFPFPFTYIPTSINLGSKIIIIGEIYFHTKILHRFISIFDSTVDVLNAIEPPLVRGSRYSSPEIWCAGIIDGVESWVLSEMIRCEPLIGGSIYILFAGDFRFWLVCGI